MKRARECGCDGHDCACTRENVGESKYGSTGKWLSNEVPHRGWVCRYVYDLGEGNRMKCNMCERENIRFVHVMYHENYSELLDVGCICAGHMENNIPAAKKRRLQLVSKTVKIKRWNKQYWIETDDYVKLNDNGRRYFNHNIKIIKDKLQWIIYIDNNKLNERFTDISSAKQYIYNNINNQSLNLIKSIKVSNEIAKIDTNKVKICINGVNIEEITNKPNDKLDLSNNDNVKPRNDIEDKTEYYKSLYSWKNTNSIKTISENIDNSHTRSPTSDGSVTSNLIQPKTAELVDIRKSSIIFGDEVKESTNKRLLREKWYKYWNNKTWKINDKNNNYINDTNPPLGYKALSVVIYKARYGAIKDRYVINVNGSSNTTYSSTYLTVEDAKVDSARVTFDHQFRD